MKILHVTVFGRWAALGVTPADKCTGGGIAKNMLACAGYAKRQGLYESVMSCAWDCAFTKTAREAGFDVEVIPSRWITVLGRPITVSMDAKRIADVIRKNNIDVVHAYNFSAGLSAGVAAKQCGVPMVVSVHQDILDYMSESPNPLKRLLSWIRKSIMLTLWRVSAKRAKRIMPVAAYLIDEMKEMGINTDKVEVVHNGLDFDELQSITGDMQRLRNEFHLAEDDVLIGSAGRLAESKGYTYLIEAAAMIDDPKAKFVVMGDGEERERLEAQVSSAGLNGRFIFTGQRDDLPEVLPSLDMFVLPSLKEGMPTVVLEAMYAKVPVIATAVSGTPELVIDGETGLLVAEKDPEGLAQAIENLLKNKDLKEHLVQEAYTMVCDQFSLKGKVDRLQAIYREVKGLS